MEGKIRKIVNKACKLQDDLKDVAPDGVFALVETMDGDETLEDLDYLLAHALEADVIAEYTVYRLERIADSVNAALKKARKQRRKMLARLEKIKGAHDDLFYSIRRRQMQTETRPSPGWKC